MKSYFCRLTAILMMKKSIVFLVSIVLFTLCSSLAARAQETGGEIQGTVRDTAGAVVSNASVSIRGVNVGFNRTFTTNEQGFFRAGQLPPGIYNITIGAISGFAEQVRENIQVNLGVITPVNVELSAQAVTGEVTVTADVIAVDPTDTKAQDNFRRKILKRFRKATHFLLC